MTHRTNFERPVALINLSSASSEDISAELAAMLRLYGYGETQILMGESGDMAALMARMHALRGDLLISFGGDGTAAAVASIAREQSVPFLALPGGTMNMLMIGLYGTDDWRDCLIRGLAVAQPRPMTAGIVSDATGEVGSFLVGAMFGKTTRISEAREELREGHVVEAARDALQTLKDNAQSPPIEFAAGDASFGPQALQLINTVCPFMHGDALNPDTLDVTLLESVSGGSALSLGMAALLGNIRQSEVADHLTTPLFRLRAEQPIEGLLDGEPVKCQGDVTVHLDRAHGLVMAPWPAMSFPDPSTADAPKAPS